MSMRMCSLTASVQGAASRKTTANSHHCSSSQAFELMSNTLRMTALPALITAAATISQATQRPIGAWPSSMRRLREVVSWRPSPSARRRARCAPRLPISERTRHSAISWAGRDFRHGVCHYPRPRASAPTPASPRASPRRQVECPSRRRTSRPAAPRQGPGSRRQYRRSRSRLRRPDQGRPRLFLDHRPGGRAEELEPLRQAAEKVVRESRAWPAWSPC